LALNEFENDKEKQIPNSTAYIYSGSQYGLKYLIIPQLRITLHSKWLQWREPEHEGTAFKSLTHHHKLPPTLCLCQITQNSYA